MAGKGLFLAQLPLKQASVRHKTDKISAILANRGRWSLLDSKPNGRCFPALLRKYRRI